MKILFLLMRNKKHAFNARCFLDGGSTEIRTQAGLASPIGFQDRPLQPLGYASVLVDPIGLEPITNQL